MPIITDEVKIKECQEEFKRKLIKATDGHPIHITIRTGYGDPCPVDAFYSKSLNMWFSFTEALSGTQSWNPFEIGEEPKANSVITYMTCQINFPKEGKNLRVKSFFFKNDNDGKVSVYHTGVFKGKGMKQNKGIKDFFFKNYKGETKSLPETKHLPEPRVALVCNLDSPKLANEVKDFVCEVKRIKKLAKSQSP